MSSSLAAGAEAIGIVLLINVAGAVLARRGVLTQELLTQASRLTTMVLFPALIFAKMGATLTPDMLLESWPLLPAATLFIVLGAALGWAVSRCLIDRRNVQLRMVFVLACSFSNTSALPLVLVEAICAQQGDALGDDCFDQSATYIFIWGIVWNLLFWTIAYTALSDAAVKATAVGVVRASPVALATPPQVPRRTCCTRLKASFKRLYNPPIVAILLGIAVALVPPVQRVLFDEDGELRMIGTAIDIVGQAATPVITVVIAGTLGHSVPRVARQLAVCTRACTARAMQPRNHAAAPNPGTLPGTAASAQQHAPSSTLTAPADVLPSLPTAPQQHTPSSPTVSTGVPSAPALAASVVPQAPPSPAPAASPPQSPSPAASPLDAPPSPSLAASPLDAPSSPSLASRLDAPPSPSLAASRLDAPPLPSLAGSSSRAEALDDAAIATAHDMAPSSPLVVADQAAVVDACGVAVVAGGSPTAATASRTHSASLCHSDSAKSSAGATTVAGTTELSAPPKTLASLVMLRMIFIPLVCVAVSLLSVEYVLPKTTDSRLKLVLLLECATPSANLLVVTSTHVGFVRGAEFLAASYILQYLVGILTMTAGASLAIEAASE